MTYINRLISLAQGALFPLGCPAIIRLSDSSDPADKEAVKLAKYEGLFEVSGK